MRVFWAMWLLWAGMDAAWNEPLETRVEVTEGTRDAHAADGPMNPPPPKP